MRRGFAVREEGICSEGGGDGRQEANDVPPGVVHLCSLHINKKCFSRGYCGYIITALK